MDEATRTRLGGGFDAGAAHYLDSRPAYPLAAVEWLVEGGARDVLDLGAGGGALTESLLPLCDLVVAVEPSAALLSGLVARLPGSASAVLRGLAEALPFAAGTFDAVTVGTAFHRMDPDAALPEIARVLRPGGRLGLVWNDRDTSTPWVAELSRLLRSAQPPELTGDWGAGSASALDSAADFVGVETAEFAHAQRLDCAMLVDLAASRSYVIALDPDRRTRLLAEVGALFDAHAGPDGTLDLPYIARCWRATRRR